VIDFAVLMIAFFLLTYCLEVQGLDYILTPNSVLYLFCLELIYSFGYLEPILE
jgi:hypothetical protein